MVRLLRTLLQLASRLLQWLTRSHCSLPKAVADEERILRAVYSPYHLDKKKKRLIHKAYDPTPKTDEISVMRLEYMGADSCKQKALSFENPQKKKEFFGFAVLRVGAVRKARMEVADSRRHYCGHADIKLLINELRTQAEPHEPLPPEVGKRLKDLKDDLLAASNYVPDPDRSVPGWHGAELNPPPEQP